MKRTAAACLSFCLCLSLSVLPFATISYASDPQTVVISIEQYNELKRTTTEQEMTLNQLQAIISKLKRNSQTDKETLTTLNNQLQDCRNRLTNAQDLLTTQNSKLNEANSLLKDNAISIEKLTKQIKSLERQNKMLKTGIWVAGIAGILIGSKL